MRAGPASHTAIAKTRGELDITDENAVTQLLSEQQADWIVNAAAYTAVDRAEDETAQARAINDTAVGVLARAAARAGSRLLHLSTDFVFDGQSTRAYQPQDQTHPLNVYGATKLAGERRALEAGDVVVLRTAWVYAAAGRNFVLTMLRLMREREEVRVVADQIGSPTWAGASRRRSGNSSRSVHPPASIIGRIWASRVGMILPSRCRTRRLRVDC